jgi:UDP-N-acetylmuramate dehydrogenase
LGESWLTSIPGVHINEPLSRHSWYGIGGPAEYFLSVSDDDELASVIARAHREGIPTWVLGAGSNTLMADRGVPGLAIKIATTGFRLEDAAIVARSGTLMPRLAADSARAGLAGMEFGAGVPGTVGASVSGNAGAFGAEVKDRLVDAEVIDPAGGRHRLTASECALSYRESAFKHDRRDWVVTAARFHVERDEPSRIRARILEVQNHRRQTQPVDKRSLGSTFKNPPGDAAGRLIDACGLKGWRIGGAQISPRHANFIVNVGQASANDVLALMAEMRDRVRERFGITLEHEIQLKGFPPE